MVLREQDKHFLWSIFAATSVILAWKGVAEGIYDIPYLADPWVFLFIGLTMLTLSGIIFKEFDPLGSMDQSTLKMMHYVHNHPRRHEFKIKYHDKHQKKEIQIEGDKLRHIEKGALVIEQPGRKQEIFIPLHRVTEVLHQGKTYWKL